MALYRQQHGPGTGLWQFLQTGTFLDGMFANWQAAILQLACLIIFGVFLVQKGATHSKRTRRNPHNRHRRGLLLWSYRNSLGLAFALLFLGSFGLHLVFGARAYNEQRRAQGEATMSVGSFAVSPKFWFSNFQTWEAEFLVISLYLLLSIHLRQEGSPESKPTASSDADTGEANK